MHSTQRTRRVLEASNKVVFAYKTSLLNGHKSPPSPYASVARLAGGPIHKDYIACASTVFPGFINMCKTEQTSEPEFVNLLWSPRIDSQPGGTERKPYLKYRPARRHRLVDSILGQLNVYKFGLCWD